MSYEVELSLRAERDLDRILAWISERSPPGARNWLERWDEVRRVLSTRPENCLLAPESGDHEEELRHVVIIPPRRIDDARRPTRDRENGRERVIIPLRDGFELVIVVEAAQLATWQAGVIEHAAAVKLPPTSADQYTRQIVRVVVARLHARTIHQYRVVERSPFAFLDRI